MKKFLFIALMLCLSGKAFSTAQYPDKIIYNGKEYSLHSNPLESYFEKHPEKRPQGDVISTALWRGYVATFEVVENQLFLKDIEVEVSDTSSKKKDETKWKSVLTEVFPNSEPLKVDWMIGLLVLPCGKVVNYVHMGYGSTHESYILLEINTGDLIKEKEYNYNEYTKFKERQFQAFKKTEDYKRIKDELKKEDHSDEFIDSFLKDFVIDYSSKILTDD